MLLGEIDSMGISAMSEAELLEVSNIMWSNAISLLGLAITLISGYLIVAYIAGANMTHSQAIIINILYIGFALLLFLTMMSFSYSAGELATVAFEMSTQLTNPPRTMLAYAIGVFVTFCVAASLKFMWDIRHPQKE
jgi:hypothetical protein